MGRRRRGRRRRVTRPKKRIPSVFQCPICGQKAVKVSRIKVKSEDMGTEIEMAVVRCGSCGIEASFPVEQLLQDVDYYHKFVDACLSEATEGS